MTYSDAVAYLYDRLPVFHRIGAKAIKPGLGNIEQLCAALGNPQHQFRSIHVGGTNGKGSSSHMLASVLQSAGYKTGLYTSPHLKSFTERIRINGLPISDEEVAGFVTEHQALIDRVQPSFFEITVALAYDFLARQQVDVAIIEVGLGGRLDSTNIITPLVSLITNIGWDHSDLLGDTLPAIASEKAGIIKGGVPVIVRERDGETAPVFEQQALQQNSLLRFASDHWTVTQTAASDISNQYSVSRDAQYWGDVTLDLLGPYQSRNLCGVLAALEVVHSALPVSRSHIVQGLQQVSRLTGLKGRWQVLQNEPFTVCDTAHNEPGIQEVVAAASKRHFSRVHWVIGMVADKDVDRVLALFSASHFYYFCQPSLPRALPAAELAAKASEYGLKGGIFPDVNTALQAARAKATAQDGIIVTGSTYLVAELDGI